MPRTANKPVHPDAKCHYCGAPATTRDHVVPVSLGGRNAKYNIVPSCESCNRCKANKFPTCLCDFCVTAVETWRNRGYRPKPPEVIHGLAMETWQEMRDAAERAAVLVDEPQLDE